MKRILTYLILFTFAVNAGAQTLSPTVISTSGNYYTGAGITWSWTLGETIIPTISGGTNMLSQGFQQPEVEILTGTVPSPSCAGSTFDLPFTAFGIIGSNNVFTVQLSDASGSFASPVVIGTTTGNTSGTIQVTIPPGTTAGSGYRIRVVSNLPDYKGKNNGMNIIISVPVTASVTISTSQNPICAGTAVTFSSTPANGGTVPSYQWKVNGVNVGTSSSTYSSSSLSNNDVVTCEFTSNAVCVTGSPATSNSITMTVNPNLPVSVNISASQSTICTGTKVDFTATPANGGTPTYQWKLNGNNVGSGNATYSNSSLGNGDVITCVMTSDANCASGSPATSNAITITVSSSITASVTISTSSTTVCQGSNVVFTALPVNGGTTPAYQWKLNGNNVGSGNATYSNSSLGNGDVITCVMTSTAGCVTNPTVTSNTVTVTVTPNVTASVSVTASVTDICAGAAVNFTATPVNGGTPSYQWKVNGTNAGTNSNVFNSSFLNHNDVVTCVMTSNANCVTGSPATSNAITVKVTNNLPASVNITSSATTICQGTTVNFTAAPTNGGSTPSYQWKVNGNNAGTNSATFSGSSFSNNDVITCVMTSNATCVSGSPAISNAVTVKVDANVTASVNISSSATTVCAGTAINFSATPVNGGTPSYQWKINGSNAGTNSTFSSSSLNNNDIITCVMTSTANCVTGSPATSNEITVTVNPVLPVSVSITSTGSTICLGMPVEFTANPTNGGAPSYQWKLNGNNVGTNNQTYTNSSLVQNDVITCVMTSTANCITGSPATSNSIKIDVTTNVTASVSITTASLTICDGSATEFTALPVNGGTTPGFQWKVNGVNAGTNSATFITSTLNSGDAITCVMTSSVTCATGSPASSKSLTVTVTPNVAASVSVSSSSVASVCPGTKVDFTATSVNGGAPSYQWKVSGNDAGTNSPFFSSTSLNNNDVITCVMTSDITCVTGSPATSNAITVNVGTKSNAGTISALRDTICDGTPASVSVTGNSTAVQWQSATQAGGNYQNIQGATNDTYFGMFSTDIYIRAVAGAAGCPDTSNEIKIVVKPSPVAAFTYTGTGHLFFNSDNSVGATVFHWEFGDGTTSDIPNPDHVFIKDTVYHVCLTAYNGSNCSFTVCKDIKVGVNGIAVMDIGSSWEIYPNPFSDDIFIRSNDNIHSCTLEVYDVLGRLRMNFENMQLQKSPVRVHLSSLSQGMYLLKIKTEKADFIHRMIKM